MQSLVAIEEEFRCWKEVMRVTFKFFIPISLLCIPYHNSRGTRPRLQTLAETNLTNDDRGRILLFTRT